MMVDIVSVSGSLWKGECSVIVAPGTEGEIGIMNGHLPLVTRLRAGTVHITSAQGNETYYVSGGILEVQPDQVIVLSDNAIRAADLDEAAILQAKAEAEEALKDRSGRIDYAVVQARLSDLANQLRTLERFKRP